MLLVMAASAMTIAGLLSWCATSKDTLMLYEVYASAEAFQAHWNGPSMKQAKQDVAGLQVSLSGVRCDVLE